MEYRYRYGDLIKGYLVVDFFWSWSLSYKGNSNGVDATTIAN